MPSGIVKREGNRLDAVYEHPWNGVASDADDADIQPSQFVQGDGLLIKNGRLCTCTWAPPNAINFSNIANQNYFGGEEIIYLRTILVANTPNDGWVLCAFSNLGRVYTYDSASQTFVLDQTMTPTQPSPTIYSITVIAGVAYVFFFELGMIYAYTPYVSYVQATSYVGGKYSMELVGHLITANTNQPSDSPAIKLHRYNWSAVGAFGVWDASIDRTAGANNLSETQDEITGCFAMGNVGYILRDQGVTQLSPTGVGVAPFSATPLWNSQFGIGCTYPNSFAQYGYIAVWANDNNIYSFTSGGAPQSIAGAAKAAIYDDINSAEDSMHVKNIISGCFANAGENSNIPDLIYILSILHFTQDGTIVSGIFWVYNFSTNSWCRQVVDLLALIHQLDPAITVEFPLNAQVQGVLYTQATFEKPATNKRITAVLAIYGTDLSGTGITYSFLFPMFNSDKGELVAGVPIFPPIQIKCKQEELRLGTKPTVRGVVVKAAGTGAIDVFVSNKKFSQIKVTSTTPKVYKSYGEITDDNPQLQLVGASFVGTIIKANMNITYDEGSPV